MLEELSRFYSDFVAPSEPLGYSKRAELRATLDAIVAELYQIEPAGYAITLDDFPLMDRYQPRLPMRESDIHDINAPTERRSTTTRDPALLTFFNRQGIDPPARLSELPAIPSLGIPSLKARVAIAGQRGAIAYVPS